MKRCPRCLATKPLSEFHRDKSKASGCVSWCKGCANAKDRADYAELRPGPIREYATGERARRKARERDQEKTLMRARRRHGGPDERARRMASQEGRCYLCKRLFEPGDDIHMDHDHDCCPAGSQTDSCPACRRGLAHAACNQIIGLCGEDMDALRTIIASFEPARDAAKARIAALKAAQPQLMPDLDMPLLRPWPQADGLF